MTHSIQCRALLVMLLAASQACDTNDVAGPTAPDSDGSAASAPVAQGGLRVELTLHQIAYMADEAVLADVTITNVGAHKVKLLSWFLPGSDLEEPTFVVTHGGKRSDFLGPHYKRGRAETGDFIHLAAGASVTGQVDLARFYDFSNGGDYAIRFELDVRDLRPDDVSSSAPLASNTTSVWVEARTVAEPAPSPIDATVGSLSFSRCSGALQAELVEAMNAANSMSDEALATLAGMSSETARYTKWFGAYGEARRSTAALHFSAIADAFDNEPVTIDCRCKKRMYAYVYPNQPYTIYVCRAFWAAPESGWNSKGGILLHEMSHFDVVASTTDWAEGRAGCQLLAESNPARALDNADSHQFFAEEAAPLIP